MISVKYIHEYDIYDDTLRCIKECEMKTEQLYDIYRANILEESVMNLDFDDYMYEAKKSDNKTDDKPLNSSKKNLLNTIGEKMSAAVMKVIDKIRELIDRFLGFFREKLYNKKNTIEAMDKLIKQHPNMADEIKLAFDKGDIEIKDYKSMHDLLNGTSDIIDQLNKGKLKPSEAQKKADALVEKWQKYGKPALDVAVGVGSLVSAAVIIKKFMPNILNADMEYKKLKAQTNELKAVTRMQKRAELRATGNDDSIGIEHTKNKIINNVCSHLTKNINKHQGLCGKLSSWLDSSLKKLQSGDEKDIEIIKKSRKDVNNIENIMRRTDRKDAIKRTMMSDALQARRTKDQAEENNKQKAAERDEERKYKEQQTAEQRKYNEQQKENDRLQRIADDKEKESRQIANAQDLEYLKAYGRKEGEDAYNKDHPKPKQSSKKSKNKNGSNSRRR